MLYIYMQVYILQTEICVGLTVFEKNVVSMPNNYWTQFCDLSARDNRILDLVPTLVMHAIGVYS